MYPIDAIKVRRFLPASAIRTPRTDWATDSHADSKPVSFGRISWHAARYLPDSHG